MREAGVEPNQKFTNWLRRNGKRGYTLPCVIFCVTFPALVFHPIRHTGYIELHYDKECIFYENQHVNSTI